MIRTTLKLLAGASACLFMAAPLALAQDQADPAEVDFGDDSSTWANDGECDDPRFTGPGMTETQLLDSDRMADATDCRIAYEAGTITLRTDAAADMADAPEIDFGDDSSMWANDDECDDPRFTGPGMTETELLESDRMADATDCRTAFEAGTITLRTDDTVTAAETDAPADTDEPVDVSGVDFGNDDSMWANDGECDDPRFEGEGMASQLLDEDLGRDATDCRTLMADGRIAFLADYVPVAERARERAPEGFEFGNNASRWARDGECDDPRFEGAGANAKQVSADLGRDAADCEMALAEGTVSLVDGASPSLPTRTPADDIAFGDDTSAWANDGECDDPRFAGRSMAAKLDPVDEGHDASDCRAAYMEGAIYLK